MLKQFSIFIVLVIAASLLKAQIPVSEYTQEYVAGWTVMVSPELIEKHKSTADSALSFLLLELIEIQDILPDAAIARLKVMPIWLEHDSRNGKKFQFFQSTRAEMIQGKYIPEKVASIEIVAGEYVNLKYRQTMPMLGYMMRAYLHRVVGDANPSLLAAYQHAKTLSIYTGEHGTEVYDPKDYFVISSRAFFTSNWQEPVDREDLRTLDSVGYEMIRTLWQDEGKVYTPPPDGRYVGAEVLGWMLVVDTQLIDKDTMLLKTVLSMIGKELKEINRILPADALPIMQKAKIYIVKTEEKVNTGRYWPIVNKRNLSPITKRRAGNLEIVAQKYIHSSRRQVNDILLHELAHAYHDRIGAEKNIVIEKAYNEAMRSKLYKNRYASTNHREYFAVLTTIYYEKNNAYPRPHFDLKTYDPDGYEMIEAVWGIPND